MNPFSLHGKTILVTGASSGIGRCIAIKCSEMGAEIILTGRNNQQLNNTLISLLEGKHKIVVADLSKEDGIETLSKIENNLDGIVHAAGILEQKPLQFLDRESLNKTMNINFVAPTLLTSRFVRSKSLNRNASIVFISSITGNQVSFIGGSAYGGSKGGINGIVKGMAIELATKSIRVNSIMPAMVETDIFTNSGISKDDLTEDKKRYPLGRYGKPEDVAYAVVYLLSDASSWMTGSGLLLDGGFTLK